MPVSPLCLVQDASGPFLPTLNGLDVGFGDTISVKLNDTTGVTAWFLQVIGTDDLSTAPTLTNVDSFTNQVTTPSTVVTFTFPNDDAGHALLFRSTVNGSGGPVNTTFGLFSLTPAGCRVGATGMILETDSTNGWTSTVNPIIRRGLNSGGVIYVTNGSPGTLDATHQVASCDTSTGTTSVNLPTTPPPGYVAIVFDSAGSASANNITVSYGVNGGQDPAQPGWSGTTSTTLSVDGGCYIFLWDPSFGGEWQVIASFQPPFPISGGGGGVTVEQGGTPVGGDPHNTLNFTGILTAVDSGGGVAEITATLPLPFSDNASGLRATSARQLQAIKNVSGQLALNAIGIPRLADSGAIAGWNLASIGRKVYFLGRDTVNNLTGALYGVDLATFTSLTAANTPIAQIPGNPETIISLRNFAGGFNNDYLFFMGLNFVTLGTIGSDGVTYNQIYSVDTSLIGGGALGNLDYACWVDGTTFAFTTDNGYVMLVDGSGSVHYGLLPSDVPGGSFGGVICRDQQGFLWTSYGGSGALVKASYNRSGIILIVEATYTPGAILNSLTFDGRYLWGLTGQGASQYLWQWDTTLNVAGPLSLLPVETGGIVGTNSPQIKWDGEALWIVTAAANQNVIRIDPAAIARHPSALTTLTSFGTTGATVNFRGLDVTEAKDIVAVRYDTSTNTMYLALAQAGELPTGVYTAQNGVSTPNSPHTAINFTGSAVTVTDAGSSVTVNVAGGSPFSDNAVAKRTTNTGWYRRNGQTSSGLGQIHSTIAAIPLLEDGVGQNTAGSHFYTLNAGAGLAVIGDNVYVTGNDAAGATASNGKLYGFNRLTNTSLTATNTAMHQYGSTTSATAACPNVLLGVRTNVAGTNTDYLFAACQKTCELGTVSGGTYTPVYTTTFSPEFSANSGVYQGAIEAVCLNQSLAGTDPTSAPWFAFVDSNSSAALWTVSPSGTVTQAFSPSSLHAFRSLCVDDDGFVWAVESAGGSTILHKLSVNYGTGLFTNVSSLALPNGSNLLPINLQSDGRNICVLSSVSPTGAQISVVDRIALSVSRTITIPGTPSAPINLGYPTRMAFDGTSMWVAIGESGTSDGHLHIYNVQTESGEVLMDLGPYTPGGNNQNNRHITVADDGTVLTTTLAVDLAIIYTSTNVPTVHGRSLVADTSVKVGGATIYSGSGSPIGSVVGTTGDLYLNTSGGSGTTLYVKESGVNTNTGWVGK